MIGPVETIPIINGKMGLSIWQNIFFYEFDGSRNKWTIIISILSD
ncbi:MAG: hypothetical protein GQ564_01115 [Bacteroidales bacterium]|nr:hypothetical protein [Bacteroidales bacterium]